jgi:hypothetical protein
MDTDIKRSRIPAAKTCVPYITTEIAWIYKSNHLASIRGFNADGRLNSFTKNQKLNCQKPAAE